MDTTLPPAETASGRHAGLSLVRALQTYPDWGIGSRCEPTVVKMLNAGLTNRCYLLQAGARRYVLRLNAGNEQTLGLDRVNEQWVLGYAAAVGIGAPVVYCSPEKGLLVTRYLDGRHWSLAEAGASHNIMRLAVLLKRVHELPDVSKRLAPAELMTGYLREIEAYSVALPEAFYVLYPKLLKLVAQMDRETSALRLCHNDPVRHNLIVTEDQLFLIDWEYAAMGDPLFDLAAAAHNLEFNQQQAQQLLLAYTGSVNNPMYQRFLHHYATYLCIDMLWYWLQSGTTTQQKLAFIAESKLIKLAATLRQIGV